MSQGKPIFAQGYSDKSPLLNQNVLSLIKQLTCYCLMNSVLKSCIGHWEWRPKSDSVGWSTRSFKVATHSALFRFLKNMWFGRYI